MPTEAPSPVPEGMSTITPHLWFGGDAREAISFYAMALGAELQGEIVPSPDGSGVWHAMLRIGGSHVMMADSQDSYEHAPSDGTPVSFWLYVEDCDHWFERATRAGCMVVDEPADMFWGDRTCKVKDPFGFIWSFSTHKWVFSEEEMAQAMAG